MGCTYFSGPVFVVHISHGDHWVNLEPFGAKVWCDHHEYLGPTFYRSEAAINVIETPSRKTWKAFEKWRESLKPNARSEARPVGTSRSTEELGQQLKGR